MKENKVRKDNGAEKNNRPIVSNKKISAGRKRSDLHKITENSRNKYPIIMET